MNYTARLVVFVFISVLSISMTGCFSKDESAIKAETNINGIQQSSKTKEGGLSSPPTRGLENPRSHEEVNRKPEGHPGLVFSDFLKSGDGRMNGADLSGISLQAGNAKWSANKGVSFSANGATTSVPGGAHHSIPMVAGTIKVQADVMADGSGFTGIAMGQGDLSGNFWKNLILVFHVTKNNYGLFNGKENMIKKVEPKLVRADAPNHLEMLVDTVARTVTAKINGTAVLDAVKLPPEVKAGAVNAAGFRFNEPVVAGKPMVSNYRAELANLATGGLEPVDVGMFFVNPDQESSFRWRVASPGPSDKVPYLINDYCGRKIGEGNAVLNPDSTLFLSRKFPRGYFEINFPEANQTFGIVALEPHAGPADPFFCMDSGLAWLEIRPEKREALVKILARSGIAMSRERLSHGSVNPEKDKWNWEGGVRANETMRRTYLENKVPILEIISAGGKHMEMMKGPPYFPQNLVETSLAWTELSRHWQGSWGGVEVFNEPDLVLIPADQYSTLVKTASFAMNQAQSKLPLVSGVFATIPPGPFFDTFAANGVLNDTDAVSLHSYDRAPDVEGMFVRYRTWLKALGKESMPLWHTECGWSWKNGPARPPMDQDAISALEISAKAVETKVCGAVRHFPFVYVYYEEGQKNFGMMGREVTPLRSMAGYAVCANFLSGKDYLGDVAGIDKSVKLARVFGDKKSGECVIMLYTGELDPKTVIRLPFEVKKISGIDGRELKAVAGKIPVPDGLVYAWADLASLGTALKTDTAAARLYAIGKQPLNQKRVSSPIILQFLNTQTPQRMSTGKYLVSQDVAKTLPVNVRFHNLSQAEIKLVPTLQLPAGGKDEAMAQVTVPALGTVDVAWKLDASKNLDIADSRMIMVTAKVASEIQPAPLAIPMVMEGNLEEHLKRHGSQKALPITDLNLWSANIAGHGKSKFSAENNVWKMDVTFSATMGSWVYPVFTLQNPIDPAVDAGFLIRARIPKSANNVAIMANPNQPDGFWMSDIFPADGEWHVVYIPFEDMKPGPGHAGMQNTRLNPATWKRIAVGMGTGVKENSLEISHLIIVGK
ncbi:MAG TPA: hypothetical protein DCZ94_10310 [Lentisphaeria bacterium]|nr:MAG: hypothetical protein A2X48_23840 [Lentisphaerae bacterium GWF2_49_21]HBC87337.1 hypothetical protein [Lentisphaeria bacterium]